MIDDLDKCLERLLRQELPESLVKQLSISFAPPDDQFPPSSVKVPAIDFFLYDVQENNDLRSNEWVEERDGKKRSYRSRRPPVRVDCSYLITAWASEASPTRAQDEHRLLGEIMKVLLRHATIPEDIAQGSLADQDLPLPTSSLQAGRLQSMGEFWQALGGKPKAALHYTVTIAVDPFAPESGHLVKERELRLGLRKSVLAEELHPSSITVDTFTKKP